MTVAPQIHVGTAGWTYAERFGTVEVNATYSRDELGEWAERLRFHVDRGRSLYVFFNNTYHANAPGDAAAFRELLETTR